jgi:preprotein translocase subunit SecA
MNKVGGDYNQRQIKLLTPIVDHINALSQEYDSLSDSEIQQKSSELRAKISVLELPKKSKDKE